MARAHLLLVAGLVLWLITYRKRTPGLFLLTPVLILKSLARQTLWRRSQPQLSKGEEAGLEVLRFWINHVDHEARNYALSIVVPLFWKPLHWIVRREFKALTCGARVGEGKVFLYFHGGAYIGGSALQYPDFYEELIRVIGKWTKLTIISVEYSLAPASPFPHALEEGLAAYRYLISDCKIAPKDIIIGGDSAGGGLALALAFRIRDEPLPHPAALVLASPWVDSRNPERYLQSPHLKTDFLEPVRLKEAIGHYLKGQEQNPLTSPILGNLWALPRMFISYGGSEIFREDIEAFIEKVKRENGEASLEVDVNPRMPHCFPLTPRFFSDAGLAINKMAIFMAKEFGHQ